MHNSPLKPSCFPFSCLCVSDFTCDKISLEPSFFLMLTVSLCCTDGYNLSDYSNLAVWQLKPFSSCLLLSCLSGFTRAGLTAPQLFSYILFLSAISPAPKWILLSLCLPDCEETLENTLLSLLLPYPKCWHIPQKSFTGSFSSIHNIFLVY